MPKQTLIWIAALIFSMILVPAGGSALADGDSVIDTSALAPLQRPPALFDHEAHWDYEVMDGDCWPCHHDYVDGELVPSDDPGDMLCSDCHDLEPNGDTPRLLSAYHHQCIGCHDTQGSGPLTCGECHVK